MLLLAIPAGADTVVRYAWQGETGIVTTQLFQQLIPLNPVTVTPTHD